MTEVSPVTEAGHMLLTVMYHYVRDVEKTPFPSINAVAVDEFRRQVQLVQETFATPPLEGCIAFLKGTWDPGRDICILTFDDGLREHFATVTDILVSHGVPGAFFLPTAALEEHRVLGVHMNHFLLAALGTDGLRTAILDAAQELSFTLPPEPDPDRVRTTYRWDDPETARLKYLVNHQLAADESERLLSHIFPSVLGPTDDFARDLYLSWDEARTMQDAGLDIGGHTHSHRVLSRMADQDRVFDLDQSTHLLSERLGEGVRSFAYPYGKPDTYSPEIIQQLESLGYLCAFNTTVGRGHPGVSRWEIPRVDPKDL